MKYEANVVDVGLIRQAPWRRKELSTGITKAHPCPREDVGNPKFPHLSRHEIPALTNP